MKINSIRIYTYVCIQKLLELNEKWLEKNDVKIMRNASYFCRGWGSSYYIKVSDKVN